MEARQRSKVGLGMAADHTFVSTVAGKHQVVHLMAVGIAVEGQELLDRPDVHLHQHVWLSFHYSSWN